MEGAGGDGGGGAVGAEVDGGERVAHLSRLVTPGVGVAETELAGVVDAPALDRAVGGEGARVLLTGRERTERPGGAGCLVAVGGGRRRGGEQGRGDQHQEETAACHGSSGPRPGHTAPSATTVIHAGAEAPGR